MTKYTFSLNNNPSTFYAPKYNNNTDYSKILDDLIAADIADKNPWLYSTKKCTTTCPLANSCGKTIKIKINGSYNNDLETAFIHGNKFTECDYSKAFDFLANLPYNCPFKKNTTYKLSNGDYIEITDDYIHINEKMYFFNLMDDNFFYNLSSKMKKTIAIIYIDGLKITIKK